MEVKTGSIWVLEYYELAHFVHLRWRVLEEISAFQRNGNDPVGRGKVHLFYGCARTGFRFSGSDL